MNRENKRKTFEKGYYKTHACQRHLHLQGLRQDRASRKTPAAATATTAPTAFQAFMWT